MKKPDDKGWIQFAEHDDDPDITYWARKLRPFCDQTKIQGYVSETLHTSSPRGWHRPSSEVRAHVRARAALLARRPALRRGACRARGSRAGAGAPAPGGAAPSHVPPRGAISCRWIWAAHK